MGLHGNLFSIPLHRRCGGKASRSSTRENGDVATALEVDSQRTLHLSNELKFVYKQHAWGSEGPKADCMQLPVTSWLQGPWLRRGNSSLRQHLHSESDVPTEQMRDV